MKVVYFFRKPSPAFHSIEELFGNIQACLPSPVQFLNYHAKFHSKGVFKRLWNAFISGFNQGEVNHITGDIHYVALFLRKNKTILTIHDLGSVLRGTGLKRAILKLFWFTLPMQRVRFVTVISEFTKRELLQEFPIEPDKVKVIHNCVSSDLQYTPKPFNEEETVILQIGTKENKNVENLIKAVQDTSCKLLIVGKLSARQSDLLEESQVEYEQFYNIEWNKLVDLYKRCDLLAFVSKYEGFGLPIIEANTVGRPVIAGNVASIPEVAGDSAYLVDPNNVAEIRKAILNLQTNKQLRKDLIEKGLKNSERFKAEVIAKEYVNLYKQVVN